MRTKIPLLIHRAKTLIDGVPFAEVWGKGSPTTAVFVDVV